MANSMVFPQTFEKFLAEIQSRDSQVTYFQHFSKERLEMVKEAVRPGARKHIRVRAKTIILNTNNLGDQGIAIISEILRENAYLRSFEVNSNKIGTDGARALGEALQENDFLEKLSLQFNKIGDDGIKHLEKAFFTHPTLRHILLKGNPYGENGHRILCRIAEFNEKLTIIGSDNKDLRTPKETNSRNTEVGKVLEANELGQYASTFYFRKIHTLDHASNLKRDDYADLGVKNTAHRVQMQKLFRPHESYRSYSSTEVADESNRQVSGSSELFKKIAKKEV